MRLPFLPERAAVAYVNDGYAAIAGFLRDSRGF